MFSDAIKQLIMFGDAYPHDFEEFPAIFKDPKFSLAKHQLDWRDEADELLQMVSINYRVDHLVERMSGRLIVSQSAEARVNE